MASLTKSVTTAFGTDFNGYITTVIDGMGNTTTIMVSIPLNAFTHFASTARSDTCCTKSLVPRFKKSIVGTDQTEAVRFSAGNAC